MLDTQETRDQLEAEISVAIDLLTKAITVLTLEWNDTEALGLLAYSAVSLNKAAGLVLDARDSCNRARFELRAEEVRA